MITHQMPTHDLYIESGGVRLRRQQYGHEGFTWSVPATSEYALCAPWRHRREIGHIQHFSLGRNTALLLKQAVTDFQLTGAHLVIANQHETPAGDQALAGANFEEIEVLVQYERPLGRFGASVPDAASSALSFSPYASSDREVVIAIEQDAFPWLWWSNAEDLEWYSRLDGVRIWAVRLARSPEVIGILGITKRSSSGHIDRLAVRPAYQGQGYGRAILDFALSQMQANEALRITLTTQAANRRSRALYQAAGFVETQRPQALLGRVLHPAVLPLLEAGRAL